MRCSVNQWNRGQGDGGEAGIRTLGRVLKPYNGLANRRLKPLGHLTVTRTLSIREALSCGNPAGPKTAAVEAFLDYHYNAHFSIRGSYGWRNLPLREPAMTRFGDSTWR